MAHSPKIASPPPHDTAELTQTNLDFYEPLWSHARLIEPQRFNTWPLVRELAASAPRRLEIAPGLRPRLPLEGSCFVDLSRAALRGLRAHHAQAAHALIGALPFAASSFDLICAFDILEHVVDDDAALAELDRVAAPGAMLLLSVPLHQAAWTAFDYFVGHYRRYEPEPLAQRLRAHGFTIERSAVYGMQPPSNRLLDLGLWFLERQRTRAMWWYNRVFMPLALRFQKPLAWRDGLPDEASVDEVLLLCRYRA